MHTYMDKSPTATIYDLLPYEYVTNPTACINF